MAALTPLDFLTVAATPDVLLPSRIQMAFTLAYHIILVPLGVALPLLTVLMEGIGQQAGCLPCTFGVVALTATAFSGATFLVGDARRYDVPGAKGPDLVEYFRRRAMVAAVALLAVSLVTLLVIAAESPIVFRGMVPGWACRSRGPPCWLFSPLAF
ncbi:MAG: cytochrome ubiquinol oxidase subunit I [Candidatus Dormibacteraceae bacterium]